MSENIYNGPDGMLASFLAMENSSSDDPTWPWPSFKATDWAQAFIKFIKDKPEMALDVEYMTSWMANALMRGYDERDRQLGKQATFINIVDLAPTEEDLEKIRELFKQSNNDCSQRIIVMRSDKEI